MTQNLSTTLACPGLLLLAEDLYEDPPIGQARTWVAVAFSAAVVVAVCVATGPGRAMVKLLVTGALMICGSLVASRALARGMPKGGDRHE